MFGLIVAIHLSPITTSSQGDSTSSVRVITVRKNPLTRQVRLAPNKKIADDEFEKILSQNIKKGWEKN